MISTIALSMALAMAEEAAGLPTGDPAPIAALAAPPAPPTAPTPAPPAPPVFVDGTPPKANLASFFSADDYPPAAVRAREEGKVEFMLIVGPDGRVTDCSIDQSSGSVSLDTATCRVLYRRARFEPARDLRGEPATGIFRSNIVWRIFNYPDRPWAPARYVEEMRSTADGDFNCREGWDVLREEACDAREARLLAGRARAAGMALERSIVTKLTPEGMTEAADRLVRGDPFWEAEAIFTIGADGKLLECRALGSRYLGRGRPDAQLSPCSGWGVGKNLYLPAAEGSGARTVNVSVRGYVGAARTGGETAARGN
jgi:protein TonB